MTRHEGDWLTVLIFLVMMFMFVVLPNLNGG